MTGRPARVRSPSGEVRDDPTGADARALASTHNDADESTGLLLWQVTNRWQAAQRAALKPFALTHVQFVLLASLTWLAGTRPDRDHPVTQADLAAQAATDPMMTSQVLRTLEAHKWIRRGNHPTDARARALTVTRGGAELANRANAAVEAADAAFFAPLGPGSAPFASALRLLR